MKISVWITSYNQKGFLKEAIESVLNQTLKPFQLIIVDDASKDGSQELINSYYIKYPEIITPVLHKKNTGVAQVRVDALNAVKGDYVTYVDGDDLFLPEKLELESKAMKKNREADIVFSNHRMIHHKTKKTLSTWIETTPPPEGIVFKETFTRRFPKGRLFQMELVNYQAWKKIGFHDPKLKIYEDYDMRIRLTKQLKVKYVPLCLSEKRAHRFGLSSSSYEVHLDSLNHIYSKNISLLKDIPLKDKAYILNEINRFYRRAFYKNSAQRALELDIVGSVKSLQQALKKKHFSVPEGCDDIH